MAPIICVSPCQLATTTMQTYPGSTGYLHSFALRIETTAIGCILLLAMSPVRRFRVD